MNFDFIRLACAVPKIATGNCEINAKAIMSQITDGEKVGASILAFPELCLSGSTCGDFFSQSALLNQALSALEKIVDFTRGKDLLIFMGMPLAFENRVLNVMAAIQNGEIKSFLVKNRLSPTEKRNFSPLPNPGEIEIRGKMIPILSRGIFRHINGKIKIALAFDDEIFHPARHQKLANIIVNPAASPYRVTSGLDSICRRVSKIINAKSI